MVEKIVKSLQEHAEKIDEVMKRRGISFVECRLMREAAHLIASQAEEIARERNARLAVQEEALEALTLAEKLASAAETAFANSAIKDKGKS